MAKSAKVRHRRRRRAILSGSWERTIALRHLRAIEGRMAASRVYTSAREKMILEKARQERVKQLRATANLRAPVAPPRPPTQAV